MCFDVNISVSVRLLDWGDCKQVAAFERCLVAIGGNTLGHTPQQWH